MGQILKDRGRIPRARESYRQCKGLAEPFAKDDEKAARLLDEATKALAAFPEEPAAREKGKAPSKM